MTSATPKAQDQASGESKVSGALAHNVTPATPKPRAGEHTWHDDKMLILALRDEVDALIALNEAVVALASGFMPESNHAMFVDAAKALLARVRS